MMTTIKTYVTCLIAMTSLSCLAQTDIKAATPNSAYVQDGRGIVARSAFGLCWRTGYWTPADSIPGCDGPLSVPVVTPVAPSIAPPAPIAVLPAPAKPVLPKRCDFAVTLQNDETFAFNKSILSNAAKQKIDAEVMPKLANCAKVDLVIVTGHTDRIGTQQYNQKLSEKRADVVAAYLTSKGINATIDTMGMGKTQQIMSCDDKLGQIKLSECLAPNRRVVIEGRGLAK